jgi:aryl-alcohol dehydrogenase-like predicted oxidoreductase
MRYRQLGRSGLTVSVVGLGCRSFGGGRTLDREATHAVVQAALDVGITCFDTAESYAEGESETFVGAALKERRHEVVIATKFGGPRAVRPEAALSSRRYIRQAVEGSLRRLQTDYIDLYQGHVHDPKTPVEETLSALQELIQEGKVRYIGTSNYKAWQVVEAEWAARCQGTERFISAQNEYNLLRRAAEDELLPACVQHGIGLLPERPLQHGILAGRYPRGSGQETSTRGDQLTPALHDRVEALEKFGQERGHSLLEVAISGLAAQPAVGSVIAGATTPQQVRANAGAGEWQLNETDMADLRQLLAGPC